MVNERTAHEVSVGIDYISFYVNGKEIIEHHAEPDWTLLWYLRNSKQHIEKEYQADDCFLFLRIRIGFNGFKIRMR